MGVRKRGVVTTDVQRALLWLGVVGGLCLSMGGCSTERGEPSQGVVSTAEARSVRLADSITADPASSERGLPQTPPASRDEDNLDPFGSLPLGIGFDTYTAECDPIADPYATCL